MKKILLLTTFLIGCEHEMPLSNQHCIRLGIRLGVRVADITDKDCTFSYGSDGLVTISKSDARGALVGLDVKKAIDTYATRKKCYNACMVKRSAMIQPRATENQDWAICAQKCNKDL